MRAQFRQWRKVIYALKRAYGQSISICRTSNDSTDVVTGKQTRTVTKVALRRAVIMPAKSLRAFAYDLSFIAANKNFTYGGTFDHTMRGVLISRRDVPSTLTLDNNCYLLISGRRYQIKDLSEYEELEIVAFLIDGLSNALPLEAFDESPNSSLDLGSSTVDS